MSLAHIRLRKVDENRDEVFYVVQSPDFNDAFEWQEIAKLVVNREEGSHKFFPTNIWENEKVVPPYVYGMEESDMRKALATQFAGYAYGAWTGRILSRVRRMLESGEFPDECL